MKRIVLLLALLSGLLCVGLVMACAYVNLRTGAMELDSTLRGHRLIWAVFERGRLIVSYVHYGTHSQTPDAGFALPNLQATSLSRDGNSYYTAVLPYWLLIPLTTLLPAIYALYARRISIIHHRSKHGLCSVCGYDLRETRHRCPECGTTFAPKA